MARERQRHVKQLEGGAATAPAQSALCVARSYDHRSVPATQFATITGTSGGCREDRILNAMTVVAELLEHDEAYLPIFLRLETELEKARKEQDALQRARAFRGAKR